MNNTATLIKNDLENWNGHAALYQLNPPLEDYDGNKHKYVVVSAAIAPFSGPETYIFGANNKGEEPKTNTVRG